MKRATWLIMLSTATLILVLSVTGFYLRYVKSGMLIGLVLTALLLLVLAVRSMRREEERAPRSALLLFLPLAVFLLFPAQHSGPFTPNTPRMVPANATGAALPSPHNGVIDMTMYLYASHASYGDPVLGQQQVALTGFISTLDGQPVLVRLMSSCCAADSQALVVELDKDPGFVDQSWVQVQGTYTPSVNTHDGVAVPRLAVAKVSPVDIPTDPFE